MVIAVTAHKIAYMALPKAGCTSVKEALARLDPDVTVPPESRTDVHTWHAIYPTLRFRPHRWEEYEAPGWFRFCVVRDPFRRLMSCYTNRVVQMGELRNSRRLRSRRPDLPTDPDPDFFFQHLEEYKSVSSVVKHHAVGAWLFLGPDLTRYSRVYRTEELGQLAADLAARTGSDVTMPRGNASGMRLVPDDLAPATRDALRPFLTREYGFLGEFYRNPM